MKSNEDLQKDVQDAIKWEPLLHAAEIGVTAHNGVVTLTGTVDSYSKKMEAEDAAKKVPGVKVVVGKIELKFHDSAQTTDNDIAAEIVRSFKWNWDIPSDKVKTKVEGGWVTLEGVLNWNFQKEAARRAVDKLKGVKGVTNNITIKSETLDAVEQKGIEAALRRNGAINAEDIHVVVSGTNVTLSGTVNSWYQKDEAGRIAWNAPGVWTVNNDIIVEYEYALVD